MATGITSCKVRLERFLKCVNCFKVINPSFYCPKSHVFCKFCIDILDGKCTLCDAELDLFVENDRVNGIINNLQNLDKLLTDTKNYLLNDKENNCEKISDTTDLQIEMDTIDDYQELSTTVYNKKSDCIVPKNINKRNYKGETPLHIATIKGDFEKVQKLLQAGADANTKDNAGWTPLHEAALKGRRNILVLLLDNGALINETGPNNVTALHDAVTRSFFDVVQILVSRGADINIRTEDGLTALDIATTSKIKRIFKSVACHDEPFKMKKLVFVISGVPQSQKIDVEECAKMFSAHIANEVDENTTHLIVKCNTYGNNCARTLKYMLAVARGKWIVDIDWILACKKAGKLLSEHDYEVKGCTMHPNNDVPRRAREHFKNKLEPLFNGCRFFFMGEFCDPNRNELHQLAEACGAKILSRPPTQSTANMENSLKQFSGIVDKALEKCFHYIFYQKTEPVIKRNTAGLKRLPIRFLLNSISKFELKLENVN